MSNSNSLESPPIEDPLRLVQFLDGTSKIEWSAELTLCNLTKVFTALDVIAQAEVKYYYEARRKHMIWSGCLRGAGMVLGSIGTLIPLLAATKHPFFIDWAPWGYVNLALSACFFAANSLFGGTTGHIRFVGTQLNLERLITQTRLRWFEFQAVNSLKTAEADTIREGFVILHAYAEALYIAIIYETGEWSRILQEELSKYQHHLNQSASGGKKQGSSAGNEG